MGNTFIISGVRNKRTRRTELAQLDAVNRMFSPDCDPEMIPPIPAGSHGLFSGKLARGAFSAPFLCGCLTVLGLDGVRLEEL
jgi:hypothetical protein